MSMIEKTQEINELMDAYENLLTDKQCETMKLYYQEDFSLSEIAENMNISRSAVNDTMKRSEAILREYESKLNLVLKFKERSRIYQAMHEASPKQIEDYLKQLESLDDTGGNYE